MRAASATPSTSLCWLVAGTVALSATPPVSSSSGAGSAPVDRRIALVERQLAGDDEGALALVEQAFANDPMGAADQGLDYLRGDLLARAGQTEAAIAAFVRSLGANPGLSARGRLRLAELQEASGHPEVAAGLLASLLSGPGLPPELVPAAVELLRRSLAGGGDCRVLRSLAPSSRPPSQPWLPGGEARLLALTRADCSLRAGLPEQHRVELAALLAADTSDNAARDAAHVLVDTISPAADRALAGRLGRSFFDHREFDRAVPLLREALREPSLTPTDHAELSYALGRSLFWLGEWSDAARVFGELATRLSDVELRSRAFHQQGRSFELQGDGLAAAQAFARSAQAGVASTWSSSALLSGLRLAELSGDRELALIHLAKLNAVAAWKQHAAAGALFLATSDLVRGRSSSGVAGWLVVAERGGRPLSEVAYWRGRLAELEDAPRSAVRQYLQAMTADRDHPHARAAAARVGRAPLDEYAKALAVELSRSADPADLYATWLVLGDDGGLGSAAHRSLRRHFAADATTAPYLELAPVRVADWPLWRATLRRPEERLLALGLFDEAAPVVLQHFPISRPALALTAAMAVTRRGAVQRGLYIAEVLARRAPKRLPRPLLAVELRRQLYPDAWGDLIRREAARAGIDPAMVQGVIREESRFDPRATSPANARGLMQLVLPTASRLAAKLADPAPTLGDLYQPEVSIRLGSTYLAELAADLGGGTRTAQVVAAYNAGEAQATLWQRYCYSTEEVELISKVGFKETREYLARVLGSRAQYAELYPATAPNVATESLSNASTR